MSPTDKRITTPSIFSRKIGDEVVIKKNPGYLFLRVPQKREIGNKVSIQSQGRIRISKALIKHANIENGGIFVVFDDHAEIWSQERWNKKMKEILTVWAEWWRIIDEAPV
jgi:hypothetical protein